MNLCTSAQLPQIKLINWELIKLLTMPLLNVRHAKRKSNKRESNNNTNKFL